MSVMRIAVAGTNALARAIVQCIQISTSHHAIFLSRHAQPQLVEAGYQVAQVNYASMPSLQFALRGVDTVISTVTGEAQIELIKAAVASRVRRFAPAEFQGLPHLASPHDPLARAKAVARQYLERFSREMEFTIFVCGILYERFAPGGLSTAGLTNAGMNGEGDYILNCRAMTAQAPVYDGSGSPTVRICLTSMRDVARFVTKSLDLHKWPAELRMCGDRMEVRQLISIAQLLRGGLFNTTWHSVATLTAELQVSVAHQDLPRQTRLRALLDTAEGRYDYDQTNLNHLFRDVQPTPFRTWLAAQTW